MGKKKNNKMTHGKDTRSHKWSMLWRGGVRLIKTFYGGNRVKNLEKKKIIKKKGRFAVNCGLWGCGARVGKTKKRLGTRCKRGLKHP